MKKIIIFALLIPTIAIANNIETWNTIQATKKIDDWSFNASEESRIGVDQIVELKSLSYHNWSPGHIIGMYLN